MPSKTLLAIVEDDPSISRLLEINLQSQGYQTESFNDPALFWEAQKDRSYDLVLLDVMLPGMDGFTLCRMLREQPATSQLPILMLTAKGEEIDRVLGLEIGADDYLTKPFSIRELLARIKALLRRSQRKEPEKESSQVLQWNQLRLDLRSHQAFCDNELLPLSGKEFELLHMLMSKPGWVITRESLLSHLWGVDFEGESRTVDMHVAKLRKKLVQAGGQAEWIETLRGIGYRLGDQI